jgi:hypothetical protein
MTAAKERTAGNGRTADGEMTADYRTPNKALHLIGRAAVHASGLVKQLGALQELQGDSPSLARAIGLLNDLAAEIRLLWQLSGGGAL